MYALVDCNNFYASCERVFQPQLVGKPIVILSNNDGCIISRSDEAKALGISMGAPEFKVRQELKEKNIQVFSSNYPLYGDMSQRVMKILEGFTPHTEPYSIDEAFMNFDGIRIPDFHNYGLQMKIRIMKWLSIPVSVGFAETKALSKVANKIARKFPERTKGVYVIDTEEKRIKALKWTKIEDVWGIGFRLTKKMKARNINTAYDLTLPHNEAFIKKEMGVVGLRLKYELEGKSVLELEEPKDKKTIAVTRSFAGRFDLCAMAPSGRCQSVRRVSLHARGLSSDESARSDGRAHHQQWFHLCPNSSPKFLGIYSIKTCCDRTYQDCLTRWSRF